MNKIRFFWEMWKLVKLTKKSKEIYGLTNGYLDVVAELTQPVLRASIIAIDLGNRTLVSYLGYVAGVVYCSCAALGLKKKSGSKAAEVAFNSIIKVHLSWLDGINEFIKVGEIGIDCDGSFIEGMQADVIFVEAMKLGWEDFSNRNRKGFAPFGLFSLELIKLPE